MNRRPDMKTFLLLVAVVLGALALAGPAAAAPTGWTWDDAAASTGNPTGWTWDDAPALTRPAGWTWDD